MSLTSGPSTVHKRFVHTGGDKVDPLTGWVSARLDRADAIFLEAIISRIADELASKGDTSNQDQLRAKAMGMLSSPAAVVELIGLPTIRGMLNPPTTDDEKQALADACAKLTSAFTPQTQVYVHLHADTLYEADELARVEAIGPVLVDQVRKLTGGTIVKLMPVVHVGGAGEAVDMYETPVRIKNQVILRNHYDASPWSSIPSRRCDMDHYADVGIMTTRFPSSLGCPGKPASTISNRYRDDTTGRKPWPGGNSNNPTRGYSSGKPTPGNASKSTNQAPTDYPDENSNSRRGSRLGRLLGYQGVSRNTPDAPGEQQPCQVGDRGYANAGTSNPPWSYYEACLHHSG